MSTEAFPKLTLIEFANKVDKKLDVISTKVEGFEDVHETLEHLVVEVKGIRDSMTKFVDFTIAFTPKLCYGVFVIILLAMGLKEIPKLF